MSNSSIWPIDRTLSGATIQGHSVPRSDENEEVLCIPQNSSITGASPSNSFVSYSFERGSYLSVEMQSVYSAAPADWAIPVVEFVLTEIVVFSNAPETLASLPELYICCLDRLNPHSVQQKSVFSHVRHYFPCFQKSYIPDTSSISFSFSSSDLE